MRSTASVITMLLVLEREREREEEREIRTFSVDIYSSFVHCDSTGKKGDSDGFRKLLLEYKRLRIIDL